MFTDMTSEGYLKEVETIHTNGITQIIAKASPKSHSGASPGAGPENAPLTGAEGLVSIAHIASRYFVLVEEVEHPLHCRLSGVRIHAGLLEVLARAHEAHLLGDDAPGYGGLHV